MSSSTNQDAEGREAFIDDYSKRSFDRMRSAGVPFESNEGNRKDDTYKYAVEAWEAKQKVNGLVTPDPDSTDGVLKEALQTTNQNSLDTLLLKFYLIARDDEVTPYSQETLQITKAAILEQTTKDMLALLPEKKDAKMLPPPGKDPDTHRTVAIVNGRNAAYNQAIDDIEASIQAREEQTDA